MNEEDYQRETDGSSFVSQMDSSNPSESLRRVGPHVGGFSTRSCDNILN
jgi:hypothetical protein